MSNTQQYLGRLIMFVKPPSNWFKNGVYSCQLRNQFNRQVLRSEPSEQRYIESYRKAADDFEPWKRPCRYFPVLPEEERSRRQGMGCITVHEC